jgi:hypothetical protein
MAVLPASKHAHGLNVTQANLQFHESTNVRPSAALQARSCSTAADHSSTATSKPQHQQQPARQSQRVQVDVVLVPRACIGVNRPLTAACAAAVGEAAGAVAGWRGQMAVHGGCMPTQVC